MTFLNVQSKYKMIITKTSKYAVKIIHLIAKSGGNLLPASFICQELDIPYKYITHILLVLKKKGLIESVKGKKGGYRLKLQADQIYLNQVLEIFEDLEEMNRCLFNINSECNSHSPCPLHKYWGKINYHLNEMVYNVKISDLIK